MNFIAELRWRGLVQDMTPDLEAFVATHTTAGYVGVDPSGDSMHIGNLLPVMMLVHFQRAGHTPYALVGGATGMVGDPSGKDAERKLLDLDILRHNERAIEAQLRRFLDFGGQNRAEIVNNYDWFRQVGFLDFLRDVGKHVTVNYMLAKDSVQKRIESESGISYTEFAYQLLQGYDFLHLYRTRGVRVQMGGSDQWGNITTGTHLIGRVLGHDARAFAVTCPLLMGADGKKFGKSEKGESIWLDPRRTTPYAFYQYWLNQADADAERLLHIFTLMPQDEIAQRIEAHRQAPHLRTLQKALAEDITRRVHGDTLLAQALDLTTFLFDAKPTPGKLAALSHAQWQDVAANAPDAKHLPRTRLQDGMTLLDLMAETGIVDSKGEGRRAIEKDQSVSLNARKITAPDHPLTPHDAYHGQFIYLQVGKKNRYLIQLT